MVRGTKVLLLFILVSRGNLMSQQLSHQVLVPVAGVAYNNNISYSQTIGETAVVIINSYDFVLTQGFQQPPIKLSKSVPPPGNGVKVYPNPVSDILNIELFGQEGQTFIVELLTISGIKVMSEKKVYRGQFWDISEIAVDKYSKGLYFVRVISDDGIINRTFKIDIM
jgi:hypothetical protein